MFAPAASLRISFRNIVHHCVQLSLFLGILLSLTGVSQPVYAADNSAFCATVTGAPAAECEALMDIYDNTGGPNWTSKAGWGTWTTICNWTGVSCAGGHVTSLSLSSRNMTGAFAMTKGSLDFITSLTLSTNALTGFDGTGFSSLTTLYLNVNQITSFSGNYPALTYLELSTNALTSFDGSGLPELRQLYTNNNPSLVSLSFTNGKLVTYYGLYGMTALTSLDLHGNKLNALQTWQDGANALANLNLSDNAFTGSLNFYQLKGLVSLDMSNNSLLTSFYYYYSGNLTSFNGTGMTSLTSLSIYGQQLTSFDATGMTSLTSLDLHSNKITSFSGVGLGKLTSLQLYDNQLTSFDDDGFTDLTYLGIHTNPLLPTLTFTNGKLTGFSASGMTALTMLDLSGNKLASTPSSPLNALTSLNLSNNLLTSGPTSGNFPALKTLNLANNALLTSVSFVSTAKLTSFIGTGMTALTTLTLSNNDLSSLDNTGMTALTNLTLNGNKFTTFSGAGYGALTSLTISSNLLTSFDDEGFTNLTSLTISSNALLESLSFTNGKLVTFSLSGMTALTTLDLHGNKLTSFSPSSYGTALTTLDLSDNLLTSMSSFTVSTAPSLLSLNLSNNAGLTSVYVINGKLTSFIGTGMTSLTTLTLNGNALTSLDNTGMTSLTTLTINNNSFTTFSGAGYGALTTLTISSNSLTSFDDEGFTNLTSLTISSNTLLGSLSFTNGKLVTFSGTGMTALTTLDLHGNKLASFSASTYGTALTTLDLSNNLLTTLSSMTTLTALRTLNLSTNYLTSIPSMSALTSLDASNNRLTTFSGSGWGALVTLDLSNNINLSSVKLSSITSPASLTSLKTLNLSHNGFTALASTGLGSVTNLNLSNNLLTFFTSTGWGGLTTLNLNTNQLTSFDGTIFSLLTSLDLGNNLLLAFSNTGLTGLNSLNLSSNLLTSFNSSGYTNLNSLSLANNQITTLPGVTDLTTISSLLLTTNCLSQLELGFTVSSWLNTNADDTWTARSASCPSFCTSVTDVGELQCGALMNIFDTTGGLDWTQKEGWGISTTACSWGGVTCTNNNVTSLNLSGNNLIGTFHVLQGNLDFLQSLNLSSNALTVFDGTGLDGLTSLNLSGNTLLTSLSFTNGALTTFIGTGMTGLTSLNLSGNQLTSFDGSSYTSSPALSSLNLSSNALTVFDGTGLGGLTSLNLSGNTLLTSLSFTNGALTTFIGTGMTGLTSLNLSGNQLTSFDGSSYTSSPALSSLNLSSNALTSFTGNEGLGALTYLNLNSNLLTSFTGTGLTSLTSLSFTGNLMSSLTGVTPLTGLSTLYATNNCFVESTLGTQTSFWLDTYSTDNWLPHNVACVIPIIATCSPSTTTAITGDTVSWTVNVSGGMGVYIYSWTGTDSLAGATNPLVTTYSTAGLKTASVIISSGDQTTEPIECSAGVTISTPVVTTFCDTITDGVPKAECEALMNIYDTTGGISWTNNDGWGTSTEVCSWYGVVCSGENRVIGLDLSTNNVIGAFALTQGNLNALSDLDISNNQLTSFVSTWVAALTVLDLSGNQLTTFSGSGLKALRDLNLRDNQLVSFDGTGFYLLKYLYLQNNNINSLQKVTGLKKILTLQATQNCLNGDQLDISTVAWLNKYKTDNWQTQNETCINSFVIPSVTIGDTTAVITWATDNEASSLVEYGLTASTRSSTPETNTSPRVTDHNINLVGLARCTTYDYRVVSQEANSHITTSIGNTFTTSGCAASSVVVDTSTEQIPKSTGGTLVIENTDFGGTTLNGMTLTIPSDFSGTDANFQAQQLDKTTVIETLPVPSGYTLPENMIYELRAVTDDSAIISTFDHPLTMTMTYGDSDIVGIKEETLRIYSSNGQEGSSWSALPNCVVDMINRTVTCSTTHFSVFALFGEEIGTIPTVMTPTSSSVTTTSALLGADVVSLGVPADISARGICWGAIASPVTNCTPEGNTTLGVFTQTITGLTPNTTYHYRGYVTNATGTAYSADGTFTTISTSDSEGSDGSSGGSSSGSSGGSPNTPPKKSTQEPIKIPDTSFDAYIESILAKKRTGFATRLETVLLALKVHGKSLVANYACLKIHTDTSGESVPNYTCQVAETARAEKIISQTNKQFKPLQSVSRIEAYSIMMKSICVHPQTLPTNWQTEVIKKAIELGFTVRTIETFEPDRFLTKQEMYIVTKRLNEHGKLYGVCKV